MALEKSIKGEAPRLRREMRTVAVMMRIYCYDVHRTQHGLCDECSELFRYAMERLNRCVYREKKPTCAKCSIHCYRKDKRERIREIMRYSGPRLLFSHPFLAVMHLIDGQKQPPDLTRKKPTSTGK